MQDSPCDACNVSYLNEYKAYVNILFSFPRHHSDDGELQDAHTVVLSILTLALLSFVSNLVLQARGLY